MKKEYVVNFDELSVSYMTTKGQVVISEDDYIKLKNGLVDMFEITGKYAPIYGSIDEEDFEVEKIKIVDIFEREVK